MWYMSYLLFAAIEPEENGEYVCETCNVLLEALNAEEAYRLAELWSKEHESESMKFVGVEWLSSIQEERPGHGDEVAGQYFDQENIWSRVSEFIPEKETMSAFKWEGSNADTPLEELMDDDMKKRLKRVFDSE